MNASYVEGFIRLMSEGAQCSKAACKNTGLRINQGAVEVQKNGVSHNPNIAAEGNRVHVGWFDFPFGSFPDWARTVGMSAWAR